MCAALGASTDGIVVLRAVRDRRGAIIDFELEMVSATAEGLLNQSAPDLIGTRLSRTMSDTPADQFACYVNAGWFDVSAMGFSHVGLVTIFRDVTGSSMRSVASTATPFGRSDVHRPRRPRGDQRHPRPRRRGCSADRDRPTSAASTTSLDDSSPCALLRSMSMADHSVTASVGIAVSGSERTGAAALLDDTDTAMYRATSRGGGRVESSTPTPCCTI